MNLQSIVSRELSPMKPCVVTVGKLVSGTRFNIVSGEAEMEGTCRCFDVELHHSLPALIERIAARTAETYRCTAEVEYNMSDRCRNAAGTTAQGLSSLGVVLRTAGRAPPLLG